MRERDRTRVRERERERERKTQNESEREFDQMISCLNCFFELHNLEQHAFQFELFHRTKLKSVAAIRTERSHFAISATY